MTTILNKKDDAYLRMINMCNDQVSTGIIMPVGAYQDAFTNLREVYSDDEIYSALKSLRSLEKDRELSINMEGVPFGRYRF